MSHISYRRVCCGFSSTGKIIKFLYETRKKTNVSCWKTKTNWYIQICEGQAEIINCFGSCFVLAAYSLKRVNCCKQGKVTQNKGKTSSAIGGIKNKRKTIRKKSIYSIFDFFFFLINFSLRSKFDWKTPASFLALLMAIVIFCLATALS